MELIGIIAPVLFIFLIGFIGQKFLSFDIKTLSTAALYLMSPFLAFRTFYKNELDSTYLYIAAFALILLIVLFITVWITASAMKASRSERSAMILSAAFMNSGNYGVPVVLFAFGSEAFDYGVIMMVFQSILMNSIGIFFASIGGEAKATWRDSMQRVIRMPLIYAAILGVIFQYTSINLSDSMMQGVDLIADASIPVVMLVLGMQLAMIVRKRVAYRYVTAATLIRMVFSPIIAVVILLFLPVDNLLKAVLIIQAAMPGSANTTMFAVQFGTEPDLVSFTTLATTLLSLLTIPIVLYLVMT
ncbi:MULTISPECIES: AEC family transporter [Sporosarcina]|uniref:AEC family transporter n=1 Tax=Sporosarcina TaxID=1569 RepID=UPI001891C736|nr:MULTISPECIES: AEC family transporter [Sporosarcina]GKV66795.1 membrane protein [Sporosarcina sp. NCCP-2331]GLB57134.1 membrane protein [Sporosarcina sp. NCCP-2378]